MTKTVEDMYHELGLLIAKGRGTDKLYIDSKSLSGPHAILETKDLEFEFPGDDGKDGDSSYKIGFLAIYISEKDSWAELEKAVLEPIT